jgi:serine/threonine-protein kinase RsbW
MTSAPMRVILGNRLEELEPARQAMLAHLAPAALSPQVLFKLELVLEETFMNLLWHAFKDGGDRAIELSVQRGADEVVLGFVDDGVPFAPTLVGEPLRPSSLDEAPAGGRGLALVRRAAKRIEYRRSGHRNHLHIAVATA